MSNFVDFLTVLPHISFRMRLFLFSILAAIRPVSSLSTTTSSNTWLPRGEMVALQHLHDGTGGDTWAWKDARGFGPRWNFTQDAASGVYLHNPCSDDNATVWQGITCSNSSVICATQECHITRLDLSRYNVQGTLSSSLGELSYLEYLGFWDNAIYGSIPNLEGLQNLEVMDFYSNQLSGEIPTSLCQLTTLQYLYLGVNNLNGPILVEFGQFVHLKYLSLQNNMLTGSVVPELGLMVQLEYIYLNGNHLEGPLPVELGQWINLLYLSLYDNLISGPLLPEIGQMVKLNTLYLSDNSMTGPLVPALGHLVLLNHVLIYNNRFTGSLPPELGQLVQLQYLSLFSNLFTGPLIPELGQMVQLEYISLYNNMITGSVIPELGILVKLEYLSLSRNFLTGALIPEIGTLVQLDFLTLAENFLTGSLPSELGQLILLDDLKLFSNHFEYALPPELSHCQNLRAFQVQNNLLTGSLQGVFADRHLAVLENLDLSDNRISGVIPQDIFELPSISAIALSLNCLEGTLPEGMCVAHNVSVLSMDGLGAAGGCKHAFTVPLSGVTLFRTMEGSIPRCLWSLPLLTVLHLTGNGLSGSISDVVAVSPSLKNISLAHNKIGGTIPISMQERAFEYLDLSFNKLAGTYTGHAESAASNSSRLFLEVNRLSGRFPAILGAVAMVELNALRVNLFGCGNIPDEDAYSDEYICGSEELDVSLYLILLILVLLGMGMFVFYEATRRNLVSNARAMALYRLVKDQKRYFAYLYDNEMLASSASPPSRGMGRIRTFGQELSMATKLFGTLLCIHLVTCIPLYGLKIAEYGVNASSYMTHSYQYRWLFSLSYLRGGVPLALLLFMWATCVCALRLLTAREGPLQRWFPWLGDRNKSELGRHASVDSMNSGNGDMKRKREEVGEEALASKCSAAMYILIMLLNASIVGCVNGVYIYFSSQALSPSLLVGMQIILALFKVLWSMVVVPVLSRPLRGVERIVRVELLLRIVNDIFLPCVVAALTSPACFQGFLVDPAEVTSTYAYTYCDRQIVASNTCLLYATTDIEVAPLIPPYSYNNLCSSVLLTSYIPVFLLVYSIQILVPIVYICLFTTTMYTSVPKLLRKVIQGVFWPDYWLKNETVTDMSAGGGPTQAQEGRAEPVKLLKAERIISSDILSHLLLFFTFGMCSPFLSLAIVLAASLKQRMWIMLLGRFLALRADLNPPHGNDDSTSVGDTRNDAGADTDAATSALGAACVPVLDKVTHCVWPIIWTSTGFFSLLGWDILGDTLPWRQSVLAPVLIWSITVCLLLASKARRILCPASSSSSGGRSASDANMISMGRLGNTTLSVFHQNSSEGSEEVNCNPLQEVATA